MHVKHKRCLWLWAGALALGLVTWVLVLPDPVRLLLGLAIAAVLVAGWRDAGRATDAAKDPLDLPAASAGQPLVLVCGDGLPSLFGEAGWALSEAACYLRVATPEQLPGVVAQVLEAQPQRAGQLALQWVVNPAEHRDSAQFAARLRAMRHQLGLLRKRGVALPLLLTGYLHGAHCHGQWFRWRHGDATPAVGRAGHWQRSEDWQQGAEHRVDVAARLQAAVQVAGAVQWWQQAVLAPLREPDAFDPPCVALAWALALVPSWPQVVHDNLWQQWVRECSGLQPAWPPGPASREAEVRLPFADELIPLLPRRPLDAARRRAWRRGLWLGGIALAVGMASSAWHNGLLLRQVSDDLQRFHTHTDHEPAVAALRTQAAQLQQYYRHGVPLRLGFGLYRAEPLRLPLAALLAAHRSPVASPAARVVRLDSLALFEVASAELRPGSDKLLIQALLGIKAQPGWLIVVAGHTDASGDSARNDQLSLQRAQAVRDWMQRMGDIAQDCFAVQGHGARQPLASNDTAQGRRHNRRVDIRLLPEEGACGHSPAVADANAAP